MYTYRAHITEAYDGDTVTALVDLGFHIQFAMKLRLHGINAPELRGDERLLGLVARDKLRELILHRDVTIQTFKDKQGKYGRYLALIFCDGVNVNQAMIDAGCAVEYLV